MQHAQGQPQSAQGQQHPISLYLAVWVMLFVLSACSYAVDYFGFHGLMRWGLVVTFMLLKAGAIVAVFMHMRWERSALMYAILLPPLCLLVLVTLMTVEGSYTFKTRGEYFAPTTVVSSLPAHPTE
jgi:cytochrome c oxidase subunit IV